MLPNASRSHSNLPESSLTVTNTMFLRKTSKETNRVVIFDMSRKLKVEKDGPKAYNRWKKKIMKPF